MKNKYLLKGVQALIIIIIIIIIIMLNGCAKEDTEDFIVKIIPVNEFGTETCAFREGDSLFFDFSLTNQSGKDAKYDYPCGEYEQYLEIYKKDSLGVYQYFGRPGYGCYAIYISKRIKNGSTIQLTTFPWTKEFGCPELKAGKYYAGDTFTLRINNESNEFSKRMYFEIY